jgi:DNA-binding transcriptional ArsR family regulator
MEAKTFNIVFRKDIAATMNTLLLHNAIELHTIKNKKALYILRAINHPLRLDILKLIDEKKKITVTEIYTTLEMQQAVASQHLAVLRRAGFVSTKKESKFVYYTLCYNFIEQFTKTVELIVSGQ